MSAKTGNTNASRDGYAQLVRIRVKDEEEFNTINQLTTEQRGDALMAAADPTNETTPVFLTKHQIILITSILEGDISRLLSTYHNLTNESREWLISYTSEIGQTMTQLQKAL